MNRLQLFLQVTRARTLPVMLAPVLIGSILAWQQGSPFYWGLFALTLIGALAAHLGANVVNDVFDFSEGADQAAARIMPEGQTVATGSTFLLNGKLSLRTYRVLAFSCFAIALICGIVLSLFRPWALALGELDILISFGILPVVGSYYTQSGTVTLTALLASLPIGLYTMVVLYFHHFLHWRADKQVGKVTPVVALGEHGARIVGAFLLLLIAIVLLIDIFLRALPWYSIIAALTIIPVQFALRDARGDLKQYLKLMATNFNGDMQAALLIVIALLVSGFLHV